MTGKLNLVALPIGNLEDITIRAIRILRSVDGILAEDTRTTKRVLDRYRVDTPFFSSLFQGGEHQRIAWLLRELRAGKDLALVSDAGMPLISDPGYPLVRGAISEGVPVIPIPGPSAAIAGLVASGMPPDRFCFEGAVPRKASERRSLFERLRDEPRTTVLFESPHRLLPTLRVLAEVLPDRAITVARELTKRHEEFLRGSPEEVLEALGSRDRVRGECVLVLAGSAIETVPEFSQPFDRIQARDQLVVEVLERWSFGWHSLDPFFGAGSAGQGLQKDRAKLQTASRPTRPWPGATGYMTIIARVRSR